MITRTQAWEIYVQGMRDRASTLLDMSEVDSGIRAAALAGEGPVEFKVYYDFRDVTMGSCERVPDSFLRRLGDLCEYLRLFGYTVNANHGGYDRSERQGFYSVRVSGWHVRSVDLDKTLAS